LAINEINVELAETQQVKGIPEQVQAELAKAGKRAVLASMALTIHWSVLRSWR